MYEFIDIRTRTYLFLKKLYEITKVRDGSIVNTWLLGEMLGLPRSMSDAIVGELVIRKAAKRSPAPGFTEMLLETNAKLKEFLSEIDTPYANELNGENMPDVQNNKNNPSTWGSLIPDYKDLFDFVMELYYKIPQFQLNSTDILELNAEITTIEAQIKSPHPKDVIIKESLRSINDILEDAEYSGITNEFLEKLSTIIF